MQRAARAGIADAMQWLGTLCARGVGVQQNEALAIDWLKQAARHGYLIAQRQVDELEL